MRRGVAALLLLALLFLNGCGNGKQAERLQIVFFAAGKADAILLTTDNACVLIDTGEAGFGKEIVDYLGEKGIAKIDYLILTHFDKDHVGGAAKVIRSIPICHVLQSNYPKDSSEYRHYLTALQQAGMEAVTVRQELNFELDGVSFTVNPPEEELYEEDASNNSSLIVSVTYGECSLLFLGDAENARLKEWISSGTAAYDLVKLPHHGNWHKPLSRLLELTQPTYAVICCSEDEPEDEKTAALLDGLQIDAYYTRVAPVLVECDGETLRVRYDA